MLEFRSWGGKRKGAGRKRQSKLPQVPHRRRGLAAGSRPLHVTLRTREGVPSLRQRHAYRAIEEAIRAGRERFGFRAVEFSVLANHLHLLVEAENEDALRRGMQGLAIRVARAINRALGRTGKVFADRFHARELATPTEVRNALLYVLNNARHHAFERGVRWARKQVDPFSSANWFEGWSTEIECPMRMSEALRPGARPRTWLLSAGWRRLGLLDPSAAPGRLLEQGSR